MHVQGNAHCTGFSVVSHWHTHMTWWQIMPKGTFCCMFCHPFASNTMSFLFPRDVCVCVVLLSSSHSMLAEILMRLKVNKVWLWVWQVFILLYLSLLTCLIIRMVMYSWWSLLHNMRLTRFRYYYLNISHTSMTVVKQERSKEAHLLVNGFITFSKELSCKQSAEKKKSD